MKFYIIDGTYSENCPQGPAFKEILDAHHSYWSSFICKDKVLVSGPTVGGAGIVIVKAENDEEAKQIIDNDPFVTEGIATFTVTEFKPYYLISALAGWFSS